VKTIFLFCVGFSLGACSSVESRYAANIPHVYVSPWTHLTSADREQIVRLVSEATRQPIQAIARWKPDSKQIAVFTGFPDASTEVHPWMEYQFEKGSDGWHMVGQAVVSQSMVHILLSYPPNDTRKPKET
jgi:hypothetical protein